MPISREPRLAFIRNEFPKRKSPKTMRHKLLTAAEESSLRAEPLQFEIGDTIEVHQRILEGDKERIQIFNGTVIARRGGGTRESFTVRRIVAGEGVERTFPTNSPKIAKVEVKRRGRVRRAKLFYLRDRVGKATRLTERTDKVEKKA
jgi:large subunit ribosomal protein L19